MNKKLTPSDMQSNAKSIRIDGHYNWNKQVFEENVNKAMTYSRTSNQTCSGQHNWVDDYPTDSFSD